MISSLVQTVHLLLLCFFLISFFSSLPFLHYHFWMLWNSVSYTRYFSATVFIPEKSECLLLLLFFRLLILCKFFVLWIRSSYCDPYKLTQCFPVLLLHCCFLANFGCAMMKAAEGTQDIKISAKKKEVKDILPKDLFLRPVNNVICKFIISWLFLMVKWS